MAAGASAPVRELLQPSFTTLLCVPLSAVLASACCLSLQDRSGTRTAKRSQRERKREGGGGLFLCTPFSPGIFVSYCLDHSIKIALQSAQAHTAGPDRAGFDCSGLVLSSGAWDLCPAVYSAPARGSAASPRVTVIFCQQHTAYCSRLTYWS